MHGPAYLEPGSASFLTPRRHVSSLAELELRTSYNNQGLRITVQNLVTTCKTTNYSPHPSVKPNTDTTSTRKTDLPYQGTKTSINRDHIHCITDTDQLLVARSVIRPCTAPASLYVQQLLWPGNWASPPCWTDIVMLLARSGYFADYCKRQSIGPGTGLKYCACMCDHLSASPTTEFQRGTLYL
jgi:hypothetical protein